MMRVICNASVSNASNVMKDYMNRGVMLLSYYSLVMFDDIPITFWLKVLDILNYNCPSVTLQESKGGLH